MGSCVPPLSVHETGRGCRLALGGVGHGDGDTLQEAADDLVARVLDAALAIRARGVSFTSALVPDLGLVNFLDEVAELAAHGGDVRRFVLSGERTHTA
jgi:hypothetical protein